MTGICALVCSFSNTDGALSIWKALSLGLERYKKKKKIIWPLLYILVEIKPGH